MRLSSETKRRLRGIRDVWVVFFCFLALVSTFFGLSFVAELLWGWWGVMAMLGVVVAALITSVGYHAGRS